MEKVLIAKVIKPQGLKGELKCRLENPDYNVIQNVNEIYLANEAYIVTETEGKSLGKFVNDLKQDEEYDNVINEQRMIIYEKRNQILDLEIGTKIRVLSPVVHGEKGTHKDLLDDLKKDGYSRVRIDNAEYELNDEIILEKTKKHNIDVVIDRLIIKEDIRSRLNEAIELAKKDDYLIKLIAEVSPDNLQVSPRLVKRGSSYDVGGTLNMATIHTDLAGDVTVMGLGAGSLETASAMLTDLISILKNKN